MLESTKEPKKYPPAYRIDLQNAYGVCYKTMLRWLKSVPNLNSRYVQMYTPKQVKQIVEHLGEPPNDF